MQYSPMMSDPTDHLSNALRSYLERNAISASELARQANVTVSVLANIARSHHPRPEAMAAILSAVPRSDARVLLRAYILDDCPEAWQSQLRIDIDDCADPRPNLGIDQLTRALDGLHKLAQGDADLRQWLIDTATLMQAMGQREPEHAADVHPVTVSAPVRYGTSPALIPLSRVAEAATDAPATASAAP